MMEKLQEYQELINSIMSGNIDESMISNISSKLFSNINMQFIGGATSGALLMALLNSFLENNSNKE